MFNWKNKKVLVTGSEGFIGSHLTERLVDLGADVRAFVLYNSFNTWGWLDTFDKEKLSLIEVFPGDVGESYNVRKAMDGVDVVFHLAALIAIPFSYNSPENYVSTNVKGTLNILQAARDMKVKKIVHTSTSEVYGTAKYVPIDENHPLQGQSPYSATKIAADMLAESFYRSFDMPVAVCRPFNTYGPRQSARAVIPAIISQVLAGKKGIKLGSLEPIRDLTYVADTVDGFIKIAESEQSIGRVINIGSGQGVSIGDLVKIILMIMKSDAKVLVDKKRIRPAKSEVMRLICSNLKAKELIGWKPKHTLNRGIEITVDFIKSNMCNYKAHIYNI